MMIQLAVLQLKPTNKNWRVDETYIRVKGKWKYLYRAGDSAGANIDFLISAEPASVDIDAATCLLTSALQRPVGRKGSCPH
jgi:transposase-like protein